MKTVISTDRTAAVELLRKGELVALPTETVYGLTADALNPIAGAKIFEAKERPRFDPLIVHLPSRDWLEKIADVPAQNRQLILKLADKFWPGPFTMVLRKRKIVPEIVTAGLDTVAVRISAHPVFAEIVREFDQPLAAPSANRFSRRGLDRRRAASDRLEGEQWHRGILRVKLFGDDILELGRERFEIPAGTLEQHLERVAAEYARAGLWADAMASLGRFLDTPSYSGGDPPVDSTLARTLARIESTPVKERYQTLHAWTMPEKDRQAVRILASPGERVIVPPIFWRATSGSRGAAGATADKPGETGSLGGRGVSTARALIDAARGAGALEQLAQEARAAAVKKWKELVPEGTVPRRTAPKNEK